MSTRKCLSLLVFGLLSSVGAIQASQRAPTAHDTDFVVRFDAERAKKTRRVLEQRLGLGSLFEEREGSVVGYRLRTARGWGELAAELARIPGVAGVLRSVQDEEGILYYLVPNELSIQYFDERGEESWRAELSELGATTITTAPVDGAFVVGFANRKRWYAALRYFRSKSGIGHVGPVPTGYLDPTRGAPNRRFAGAEDWPTKSAWDHQTDEDIGRDDPNFRAFVGRYPGEWGIRWDRRTRAPSLLYGPGVPLSAQRIPAGDESRVRELALAFLHENDDFLRVGRFELDGETALAGNTWVVNLNLSFRGVPLEEHSRVGLGIKDEGALAALELESIPGEVEPLVATVAPASAVSTAVKTLRDRSTPLSVSTPSLWILCDDEGTGRLVWRFSIRRDVEGEPLAFEFFAHAREAGDILSVRNLVHFQSSWPTQHVKAANKTTLSCGFQQYAATVAADYWPGAPFFPVASSLPDALVRVIAYGSGSAYTGDDGSDATLFAQSGESQCRLQLSSKLEGRWCVVHTASSSTCLVGVDLVQTALADPSQAAVFYHSAVTEYDLAQCTAYYWTTFAHDWSSQRMGGNNGVERQIQATVNLCTSPGTAFYNGNMFFARAQSGSCANMSIADVIAHEYGHAIDAGRGGSLDSPYSEGFSDAFAMALTEQPIVGRGGCPGRDGNVVRLWTDVDADGCPLSDPHCTGHVYGGFTWKLRLLLRDKLGTTIGDETATQLVLQPAIKNPSSIPNAVFWTLVCDDTDANLNNGTPNYCEIVAAAVTRALPLPKLLPVAHYSFTAPFQGKDSAYDQAEQQCPHNEVSNDANYVAGVSTSGGGAVSFDLGTTDDQFITHSDDDLNFQGQMTGIAWIKPAGDHDATFGCNWGTVLTYTGNYWFQINENNDGILFQNEGSGAPGTEVEVSETIPVGAWTQVAFVRTGGNPGSGGAKTVRIYVDGVDVGGGSTLDRPRPDGWALTLGYAPGSGVQNCEFNGVIDEVQLYPTALTPTEILGIYNAQKAWYQ